MQAIAVQKNSSTELDESAQSSTEPATPLVSICIPVRNEYGTLEELFTRVNDTIAQVKNVHFEVIMIDNGSTDGSSAKCEELCKKDSRWKMVSFSRNFGIEPSFLAGATYAKGDALIYLFSDLQDPPELIPQIIEKWQAGSDVVYGILKRRNDHSSLKSLGAYFAYRMIFLLSDVKIPINATDYRLLSRKVIDAQLACGEKTRYMRGLSHWAGFKEDTFEFERAPRKYGKTNMNTWACIRYAINAVVAFSTRPLRFASLVGMLMTLVSFIGLFAYTTHVIFTWFGITNIPPPPPGWATIVLLIIFFGGLQCMFLGVIGEYLSQILGEAKERPMWVVNRMVGFDES